MLGAQTNYLSCWYAVHTKPRQEDRADSNLRAWRVETFAPKIRERSNYNTYTGKATFVTKPLFPRYIFAKFKANDLLHKVYYTRGVDSVVCFGGKPCPIDEDIIGIIQSRRGPDGLIRMGETLHLGDKVIIGEGPFRSFAGIFDGYCKGEERVSILLTTVSCQSRVIVERQSISRVHP
jgi:transcriptional antiterminator RfaH